MSEWTDIGEQLRKARESRGLDLRDVAHTTRIPLATLEALEHSDYSIFPSPTYARSFLAQYSEYLNVDAHEWVDAFETGNVLSNVNDHGYLQSSHDHIGSHRHNPEPARRRGRAASHREENMESGTGRTSSILQTMTVFIVTALLIGGGIYAYKEFEHLLTGSQSGETAETTEAPQKSPENPPETSAQPAETPTADQSQKPEPTQEPPAVAKNDTAKRAAETISTSTASTDTANSTPPGTGTEPAAEKPSDIPILIKPRRSGKPPKAMVVEE